ncbi:Glycine cleavage system regulatory protein [Alteromonadaceae bacterium Bs31]|nr:Glycine cleavage system regulatory protein [Alteromonadaceae bacterium Bs31]
MIKNIIITLISDDKPGVVEAVAKTISEHQGNWLESQLAKLAGKFAGVIRVQLDEAQLDALEHGLSSLKDINVQLHEDRSSAEQTTSIRILSFHATGPDRPGIVREISAALAQYSINLEKLDTRLSSMPYSGDPLFEAEGLMAVPEQIDKNELAERFDQIADELAMDISITED